MLSAVLLAFLGLSAVIAYSSVSHREAGDFSARLFEDRYAWWAPALVILAFVAFSVMPVMLLVSLTGIVFGPVLGPLYAMTGCLASASMAFAIGRWIGPRHVNGWGGERMRRLMGLLRRNGTLAVFLIRKIPLPFVLVNVMLGASAVGYREFVIGTDARHGGHDRRVGRLWISTRRDVATPIGGERHPGTLVSVHSIESGLDDQPAPEREERRCLELSDPTSHETTPAPEILQPDDTCWRVDRAERFSCVQDAADYFRLVRHAFLHARETIFILGWDMQSTLDLVPGGASDGAPTRLDELLKWVIRRRPQLTCHVLTWDYAELYALEREPLATWRWVWQMPRQVRFKFDDRHPVGGSHHQKIIVVDDVLAFCGGIDLTGHRWDTTAHRVEEPLRVNATGTPYEPYHEVQAMVCGPVAASLGTLVRRRWQALGETTPPVAPASLGGLWPDAVEPDLTDVDVAIARTVPPSEGEPAIRECELLFVDSIAAARQSIYIESQYFTNDALAGALAARLQEPEGPEIIVVIPKECHGWVEQQTMGALRDEALRHLIAGDRWRRLRVVYPAASRAATSARSYTRR